VTESGLPIIARIPEVLLSPAGSDMGVDGQEQEDGQEQGEGEGEVVVNFPNGGGVYIASGHGPWGISLSLGTGQVMAELVEGRELSADISGLGLPI
jgi:glycine/D-amino acid oxidase-like deaminating enzyme